MPIQRSFTTLKEQRLIAFQRLRALSLALPHCSGARPVVFVGSVFYSSPSVCCGSVSLLRLPRITVEGPFKSMQSIPSSTNGS